MSNRTLSGANPEIGAVLHNVVVIGTFEGGTAKREQAELELDELEELARTLSTTVVDRIVAPLRAPDPATFLRSGAVETVGARLKELNNPAVFFNDPLTPRQQRNLGMTEQRAFLSVMSSRCKCQCFRLLARLAGRRKATLTR